MKKIFINLLISVLASFVPVLKSFAVPADPRLRIHVQQGGDSLRYYVIGDEHGHLVVSTDGLPLLYNKKLESYEYATLIDGRIVPSGIVALNPEKRDHEHIEAVKRLKSQDVLQMQKNTMHLVKKQMAEQKIGNGLGKVNNYNTLGFRHSPVILIEFADIPFSSMSDAKSYYEDMLNGDNFTQNGGTGSVRQYYKENSSGRFDIQYDVYGPVRLAMPHTYYGISETGTAEALSEACKLLDSQIDFSQYDTDNDGIVDNIFFFYAGYGEADSGDANTIWPCSWNLMQARDTLMCDGKFIGSFACSNEIRFNPESPVLVPTGIGTFVHEFGHVLGLPDMYDTSYNMLSFTSSYIDLMDKGSYANDSNTPPCLSGYERYVLGWAEPQVIDMNADSTFHLAPIAENQVYMVKTDNENENFFIENRQQEGWDTYLSLHGMLVWHVDYDSLAFHQNIVNNDYTHPRVDLVEADKILTEKTRGGDSYPGTACVTNCSFVTWDNVEVKPSLESITERDRMIMFVAEGVGFTPEQPQNLKADNLSTTAMTLSWDEVSDAIYYDVVVKTGEQICQSLKGIADTKVEISGLQPDTEYTVEVVATAGPNVSTPSVIIVTTPALPFVERKVEALGAENVSETGFTARLSQLKDAAGYELTVNSIRYEGASVLEGYDFTEGIDGLPELWQTSSSVLSEVEGRYGQNSPSLRLSSDGDFITVTYADAVISKLSFWYCSAKSSGSIFIETLKGDEWVRTDSITELATTGTNVEFDLNNVDKVRIVYKRSSGYIVVDDVNVSLVGAAINGVAGFSPLHTGNVTSVHVSGLTPDTEYRYTVRAFNEDGEYTRASNAVDVVTVQTTGISDVIGDACNTDDVYTIGGVKVDSPSQNGVYIIDGKKVIIRK